MRPFSNSNVMPFQKLSPDARRMRTIIVTLPLVGVTSYLLYKRLVLGETQRRLPQTGPLLTVKTTMPKPDADAGGGAGAQSPSVSTPRPAGSSDSPAREKAP